MPVVFYPLILLLGIYSREISCWLQRDMHKVVHSSFVWGCKYWPPTCLSIGKWIIKIWWMYKKEHQTAHRSSELNQHTHKYRGLKNMSNERKRERKKSKQTQDRNFTGLSLKNIHIIISAIYKYVTLRSKRNFAMRLGEYTGLSGWAKYNLTRP